MHRMAGAAIRSFDYVNHPYATVRNRVVADPAAVFRSATRAAVARARSVAAQLHVSIAGIDVATDIAVSTGHITEDPAGPSGALVLHRLAEASVHRFVGDVARYLRDGLMEAGPSQ